MKRNERNILLIVGLMISSASQIASYFIKMPDFVLGSLMGVAIGVMLLAFLKPKSNRAS